ncbi:MAG: hypothetical protein FGM26_01170 [Beijerinckiaceae bacterium]|nr:hypothetical protein [Beijerinckiaceae bacterium]
MSESHPASNLPALVGPRSGQVEVYRPGHDEFEREPPIEVVIDADQIKEKIIDYLGAVLARCWVERDLLDAIEADPHRTLRHLGILLPSEIDIKVERPGKTRPRLVIYEYNQSRSFRRRICYLQLIMMAGQ